MEGGQGPLIHAEPFLVVAAVWLASLVFLFHTKEGHWLTPWASWPKLSFQRPSPLQAVKAETAGGPNDSLQVNKKQAEAFWEWGPLVRHFLNRKTKPPEEKAPYPLSLVLFLLGHARRLVGAATIRGPWTDKTQTWKLLY